MITLTRLNQTPVVVNAAHIATVESTPDTLITLLGGERILVIESPAEISRKVVAYLKQVGWSGLMQVAPEPAPADGG